MGKAKTRDTKETELAPDHFESWAIVEIFGHQKYAGRVSEFALGGCNFVRVDVPELPARKRRSQYERDTPASPAFTKLFGQGAIYSITLVSEAICRAAADQIRPEPINVYVPIVNERALEAGE
jgi:hypothetical protein